MSWSSFFEVNVAKPPNTRCEVTQSHCALVSSIKALVFLAELRFCTVINTYFIVRRSAGEAVRLLGRRVGQLGMRLRVTPVWRCDKTLWASLEMNGKSLYCHVSRSDFSFEISGPFLSSLRGDRVLKLEGFSPLVRSTYSRHICSIRTLKRSIWSEKSTDPATKNRSKCALIGSAWQQAAKACSIICTIRFRTFVYCRSLVRS